MFLPEALTKFFKPQPSPAQRLYDGYLNGRCVSPPPDHTTGDQFYKADGWQAKSHVQKQDVIRDVLRHAAQAAEADPRFLRHVRRSLRLAPMPDAVGVIEEPALSVAQFVATEIAMAQNLVQRAKAFSRYGQIAAAKACYQEVISRLANVELGENSDLLNETYRACFLLHLACEEPQNALGFFCEVAPHTERLFPPNSAPWIEAKKGIEHLLKGQWPSTVADALRHAAETLRIPQREEAPLAFDGVPALRQGGQTAVIAGWRRKLSHITCPKTRAAVEDKLRQLSGAADAQQVYLEQWLTRVASLPLKQNIAAVSLNDAKAQLGDLQNLLEQKVLWHKSAKNVILSIGNSCLRRLPQASNAVGLCGPSGTGKSTLVNCLGEILQRPVLQYNLHGANNPSAFFGLQRGTVGQDVGRLAADIINCQALNPIIIFEEIDKVSLDSGGQSILNKLIGLLDPHSRTLEDDFLDGVPIDLSEALFVVTYNDRNKLPQILSRSRIQEILCPGYSTEEKLEVVEKHVFPKLKTQHGFNIQNSLLLERRALQYLMDRNDGSQGIKELEIKLRDLVGQAALFRTLHGDAPVKIALKGDENDSAHLVFRAEQVE